MTLRHDMIQTLIRAPQLLNDATDSVRSFVLGQQAGDGGFRGRDRTGDLYYTVFALEVLIALECPVPIDRLKAFLKHFNHCALDLVHLASLARCWANLADVAGQPVETSLHEGLIKRLLDLQCSDGSFSTSASGDHGNAYGCYMALTMHQDLGIDLLKPECILRCLESLSTDDGGFANEPGSMLATTPSTAAALCVYHMLGRSLPETPALWLQQRIHSLGGFCATGTGTLCLPDLLSTATSLQALSYIKLPASSQQHERHLDFLDSLWDPQGGFRGNWADPAIDCEYTFYGLLALGHLADMP
jgi:prenyltransferase beta subunit